MMMKTDLGLYIHIPFCKAKCGYCDFVSTKSLVLMPEYVNQLVKEIRNNPWRGNRISSVFIGGGTPSLLENHQILRMGKAIKDTFDFSKDLEFTVEMNPESVDSEAIQAFQEIGMTRLSMGIQTFSNPILQKIGRLHSKELGVGAFQLARSEGVKNINIDLMFSLPDQDLEILQEDLTQVLSLAPEHISYYSLILEENTPIYDVFEGVDEEMDRKFYHKIAEVLNSEGYLQYEISNFAKKTFECKHNLKYWKIEDYIGFGVASHSSVGSVRFYEAQSISEYSKLGSRKRYVHIPRIERIQEFIIMGIRLNEGINLKELEERFEYPILERQRKSLRKLLQSGLIELSPGCIRLTEQGRDLANMVELELYTSVV